MGTLSNTNPSLHCHSKCPSDKKLSKRKAFKQLLRVSILCFIFIIAEIVGGVLANSLAIATDAAHLLSDLASFAISLFALFLASKPATKKLSFGWYRAEVLGAMVSVLIIWLMTIILLYLAVLRVMNNNYQINALIMMLTAALGILFNFCMMLTLGHNHSHSRQTSQKVRESDIRDTSYGSLYLVERDEQIRKKNSNFFKFWKIKKKFEEKKTQTNDINVRAAFIHVLGDLVQSIGVFIAAVIIYFKPQWKMADPICTFIFSILVILTTGRILKEIIQVLMEAAPSTVSFDEVVKSLKNICGVKEVHNLRIWSLTTNKIAMAAHLAIDDVKESEKIMLEADKILRDEFNIHESTVQLESYQKDMEDCEKCQPPLK